MYYIIISGTDTCKGPFASYSEADVYICHHSLPSGAFIVKEVCR
jgi:hypothetical protein